MSEEGEYCYFIGGLSWSTSDRGLKDAFDRFSHLIEAKMDEILKNQTSAIHAIAAAGSVALVTALTYPLDTIKALKQVGSGSSKQLTAVQVLNRVQTL